MLNIAHRGGAGLMPENTLAAFADALARGYDGAELDVQLSADGMAVVHHDFRLNPGYCREAGHWLAGQTPRIKDLTYAQLQAFDIGRPAPGSDYAHAHPGLTPVDGARIPALADVMALVAGKPFQLFVELKSDTSPDSADPRALADAALAVCAPHLAQVIFVGFDRRALRHVREKSSAAKLWFTTDKLDGDARPVIDAIADAGGQGWFPNFPDATPDAVAYARLRGLKVGAWTVDDPADMARLSGLDALCTDRPDRLRELFRAGGVP
jgi:glycerophosphoryl diester phosphodiesterase